MNSKSPPRKKTGLKPRGMGVKRGYPPLTSSVCVAACSPNTFAQRGAKVLWDKVMAAPRKDRNAFGAITAGQAIRSSQGWPEAVSVRLAGRCRRQHLSETINSDQSLYAYDSADMVCRINNTFKRADEIQWSRGINPGDEGLSTTSADRRRRRGRFRWRAERLRTDEEHDAAAGAAGVHFEDQLAAAKKCGHMGGKGARPDPRSGRKLISARFAADVWAC